VEGEALMLRRLLLASVLVAVSASASFGQTRTADGVTALARGDYPRAVEILKPIAEDWRTQDGAAQFFMAGLYESGRAVPVDPLRACALYLRATGAFDTPFAELALTLVGGFRQRGQEFDEHCQLLAGIGFDHGFEPRTFDLGNGHFVEWTLTAITVTHDGRTRRHPMPIASPGARFLPLSHTELATGRARSDRRHFIEAFVWRPAGTSGPWSLDWVVFEVVRDEIVRIDIARPLAIAEGDEPPPRQGFDVRNYAVLRVDDEGHAEWAVLKGPEQRSQRIESEAERREIREEAAARDVALKRVDWDRRYDLDRPPSMAYTDADGCGYADLYGWTADRAEVLVVRAAAEELGLSVHAATFDLAREPLNISVQAYVYAEPQHRFDFCSDVIIPRPPDSVGPATWRAVGGTITMQLSPPGVRSDSPHLRRATVTLRNIVLRNGAGQTLSVPGPVTLSAIVGSMLGG
jgi:hypothetical protein